MRFQRLYDPVERINSAAIYSPLTVPSSARGDIDRDFHNHSPFQGIFADQIRYPCFG
jgi:hypothetical protein